MRSRRAGWLAGAVCVLGCATGLSMADGPGVEIHGFLSQGYLKSTDNNYLGNSERGSFDYTEMGLNFSVSPQPKLRIGAQLFARNVGQLGRFKLELDWAYADYHWRDWLGFRAGRIKLPYGLYNETADIDSLRTTVLLPRGVYDTRYRDLLNAVNGASVYGTVPLAAAGNLEYQVHGGSVAAPADGSIAFYFNDAGLFTIRRFTTEYVRGGALLYNTPISGLRVGTTVLQAGVRGEADTSVELLGLGQRFGIPFAPKVNLRTEDLQFTTQSAQYRFDRLLLTYEHSRWKALTTFDFPAQAALLGIPLKQRQNQEAWYGQAAWRFSDLFEAAVTRSVHYSDADDHRGAAYRPNFSGWQKEWVVSTRFDVNDNWVVKLEGHDIDGTSGLLNADNGGVTLQRIVRPYEQKWKLYAAKLSYIF